MITLEEKHRICASIDIPEIKSCVAQLLEGIGEEGEKSHVLTTLALLSFYRKNLNNTMSIETDKNVLKSRLIESGVLYFGPLFSPGSGQSPVSRARRLSVLKESGFCSEHLAFLNSTQVELFSAYVRELGLIGNI